MEFPDLEISELGIKEFSESDGKKPILHINLRGPDSSSEISCGRVGKVGVENENDAAPWMESVYNENGQGTES
jgi:CheY-like chemotaxis protein